MVVLYHHTDAESAQKILESLLLKKAKGAFGTGVYLTKMGPDSSLKKLLVNNYDDDISKAKMKKLIKERGSKAEVCFGLGIPDDVYDEFVEKCDASGRDVYIFKGDITLSDMDDVDLYYRQ
ncbi:uncharacterized protein LOC127844693 [Dreissena polymorpha]|uniref:Tox-ART-HYD1 domain-containing protein n=1 Tax=Dreissena polymorpha TaxID=45954 RepID=A0A9D4EAV8_DREPO|nr:uncharacterized protein LOC127844693 [Dreissena polymorpha]KAH3775840.1 hypothetical protein DPMN_177247 [Dreissena polymorpha]